MGSNGRPIEAPDDNSPKNGIRGVNEGPQQDGDKGNMTGPEHEQTSGTLKKRKRNRKAPTDKKFECNHEGCGKTYSRAEHLYRHQLNREYMLQTCEPG